ncbi:MAG: hypothetical protein HY904_09260 [Deltaproteobacteria bacterium]|nr:hypothetical protein [Deltaproteobacteria bacterium]
MIEAVALGQARFNCPGLSADERGVAMGRRLLCLFPDLARALGFLRALSRGGGLKDILGALLMEEVSAPSGLREVAVGFDVAGSFQGDGCAAAARAVGAQVFTGTVRHHVPYRDSVRPLGCDLQDAALLQNADAGYVLYTDAGADRRVAGQRLEVRDLLLRMNPLPMRPKELRETRPDAFMVRVPRGLLDHVQGYLWRRRVDAEMSLVRPRAAGLFQGGTGEVALFRCRELPAGSLTLLQSTPGVEVYVAVLENVLVERGWRHPVSLDGCSALFPREEIILFAAARRTVERLEGPLRPVNLDDITRIDLRQADGAPVAATEVLSTQDVDALGVEVRMVPDPEARGLAEAAIISVDRLPEMLAMVHLLPAALWKGSEVVLAHPWAVVLAPPGVRALPLGIALGAVHPRVFLPLGTRFSPRLDDQLITEHLSLAANDHVVFFPPAGAGAPFAVSRGAFVPLSRAAVHPQDMAAALDAVTLLPAVNTAGEPVVYHPTGSALRGWDGTGGGGRPPGEG